MIKVTIELIPGGTGTPIKLGEIEIANDGYGTQTRGDYYARAYDKGGRLWKRGTTYNFPRKKLLVFDLLYRILGDMIGERND